MSSPMPLTTTQYPGGEPTVYIGPLMQQIGVDQLLNNSAVVVNLQAQITALAARVTALESAASPPA